MEIHDEGEEPQTREVGLRSALRRVVLLRETGPKSAAWHRARVATIWRLHRLIAAGREADDEARPAEGEGR